MMSRRRFDSYEELYSDSEDGIPNAFQTDPFIEKQMKSLFSKETVAENSPTVSPTSLSSQLLEPLDPLDPLNPLNPIKSQKILEKEDIEDTEDPEDPWMLDVYLEKTITFSIRPFIGEEIEVESKPKKRRGRPPIKDPVEKARRRRERERIAAKKYRMKKKCIKVSEDSLIIETKATVDQNKQKLQTLVTLISPLVEWVQNNELVFNGPHKQEIKECLHNIFEVIATHSQ